MKNQLLTLIMVIFLLGSIGIISSFVSTSSNDLYIDVNRTYPLVLLPLDDNVWNITLNVYEGGGNWTSLNFTWDGTQYNLPILFNQIGDYPYVINSTEVTGNITGNFFVRNSFNVTFRFYKDKSSTIFSSNKYINNMAYLTAEFTGEKMAFQNHYDPYLEPFIAQISSSRYLKPMFHTRYVNGEATLKLYEGGEYAIRLMDGEINFPTLYSVPNITKSYGTNVYIGKYTFTNSTSQSLLFTEKDLHPFRWLFNWLYIILVVGVLIVSIFLFFLIPETPSFSVLFGVGFISMLTLARIVLWIWKGF